MKTLAAAILVCVAAIAARAAEPSLPWPQFRGPNGSGIAENQKPPVEFGPEKNVKWKVAVPSGFSSPIVVGDLLALTAFEEGKLYTIAYHRDSGSEAWRAEAPAKKIEPFHRTEGSPAASTPVTDGQRIVSYFGSCGLFCYDLKGKELWRSEMPTVITAGAFGTGVSPILVDGVVILLRDELNDPKILAINVKSGELKWETKRQSKSGFCTPVVWQTEVGKQIVAPGFGQMIGYDLESGKQQWYVEGMPSACCTTPTIANDTLFFAGWSPGDSETADDNFKMPTFDETLKMLDKNSDEIIAYEEVKDSPMADFFPGMDSNKDGKYTRGESEELMKFMSASRNSAFALKSGGTGNITESNVLWKQTKGLPYVPSGILYRGQYVMVKDGGLVTAYDAASGDQLYHKRAAASGSYYGSPVAANGNIYLTSLADGTVTVIKSGAKPELVAQNPPLGERVAATPAIADDTLYLRTAGHLYAFAEQ